jgi:hypothetical protein
LIKGMTLKKILVENTAWKWRRILWYR